MSVHERYASPAPRVVARHASLRRRQFGHGSPFQAGDNPFTGNPISEFSSFIFGEDDGPTDTVVTQTQDTVVATNTQPNVTSTQASVTTSSSSIPTSTTSNNIVSSPSTTALVSSSTPVATTQATQTPDFPTSSSSPSLNSLTSVTRSATSASQTDNSSTSIGAVSTHKSNSTGIAVGVTITLIVIGCIGVWAWFARKRKIQERDFRRSSWKNGLYPALESKRREFPAEQDHEVSPSSKSEKIGFMSSYNVTKPLPDPLASPIVITPPPTSFNNPGNITLHQTGNVGAVFGSSITSAAGEELAKVRRGFLPSLPDELPITIGESITIVTAYDDGWCLCKNSRGERGMVPVECLQRSRNSNGTALNDMGRQEADGGHWRMSKRASSLYAGMTPPGGF